MPSYLFFSSLHLPTTNKLTTDIDGVSARDIDVGVEFNLDL